MTTTATTVSATPISEPAEMPAPVAAAPRAGDRSLSITALVLGVASIVFGQTFLLPIAAIVLGVIGYRREPQGRAFSVIGAALGAFAVFGWLLLLLFGLVATLPLLPLVAFSVL